MTKKTEKPKEKSWFVRALEAEMLACGLNQEQFATKILEIRSIKLSRWLNQKREPNLSSIIYVAQKLGWQLELGVPCLNPKGNTPNAGPAYVLGKEWFKDFIESEMNRLGDNQAEFARRIGVAPQVLVKWRAGSEPHVSLLQQTIEALGGQLYRALPNYNPASEAGSEEYREAVKELQRQNDELQKQLNLSGTATAILMGHLANPDKVLTDGGMAPEMVEKLKGKQNG